MAEPGTVARRRAFSSWAGMGHGHHTPHTVSLSDLTHPALEDFLSSEEARQRQREEIHSPAPNQSRFCLLGSQTLSWLCSPPTDQRRSGQEGAGGESGELRTYLATQIKQTTNCRFFFLKVIATSGKYIGKWTLSIQCLWAGDSV